MPYYPDTQFDTLTAESNNDTTVDVANCETVEQAVNMVRDHIKELGGWVVDIIVHNEQDAVEVKMYQDNGVVYTVCAY